jgi:hypothetical protein
MLAVYIQPLRALGLSSLLLVLSMMSVDSKPLLSRFAKYYIMLHIQLTSSNGIFQWFGVGSAMYDGLIAVESKMQIDAILAGTPQRYDEYYFKPRHYIYHIAIALYGIISITWMLSTNNVGPHFFQGKLLLAGCLPCNI